MKDSQTLDDALLAEWRLATAFGWTNLFNAGDTLIGTPPGGSEHSRGQAAVPRWARDWNACGPLVAKFMLSLCAVPGCVSARAGDGPMSMVATHDQLGPEPAVQLAIVQAATEALLTYPASKGIGNG